MPTRGVGESERKRLEGEGYGTNFKSLQSQLDAMENIITKMSSSLADLQKRIDPNSTDEPVKLRRNASLLGGERIEGGVINGRKAIPYLT